MDPNPWREATQRGAELGGVARLTPCPSKRRRTVAEAPTQQTRPDWADTSAGGAREDLCAFGNKMVCRLYYNIAKMVREEGGPLVKNREWFAANPDGPIR